MSSFLRALTTSYLPASLMHQFFHNRSVLSICKLWRRRYVKYFHCRTKGKQTMKKKNKRWQNYSIYIYIYIPDEKMIKKSIWHKRCYVVALLTPENLHQCREPIESPFKREPEAGPRFEARTLYRATFYQFYLMFWA